MGDKKESRLNISKNLIMKQQFESLTLAKFTGVQLPKKQLHVIVGGGARPTTWTDGGASGTDTNSGGETSCDDGWKGSGEGKKG